MPKFLHLYKDKDKARTIRNSQRLRYYQKTQLYPEKRRWTSEEDKAVLEHSITDTELSSILGRSVHAIQVRRNKLKKNNRE